MDAFKEFQGKFELSNFERSRRFSGVYSPNAIKDVLRKLDNPQKKYKTIHIAGTTGKSTLAWYLSRLLCSANLRVGLYTSPHLLHLSERIKINEHPISQEAFSKAWEVIQGTSSGNELSFFDMLTAIAFFYFQEEKVDYAVIEVGLGGRLDSTNNINPEFCCITPISLDHTAILGDTLEKITTEKAGIIKTGVPVYSAKQSIAAARILKQHSRKVKAPFSEIDVDQNKPTYLQGLEFARAVFSHMGMSEMKQIEPSLPGRMERFEKEKVYVYFDSAHAIDSINDLIANVLNSPGFNFPLRVFINTFQERKIDNLLQKLTNRKDDLEVYLIELTDTRFWSKADIDYLAWVKPEDIFNLCKKPGFNLVTGSTQLYPIIQSLFHT